MADDKIQKSGTSAIATLRDLLEKSKSKFQDVIPKHLSADRLVRVAIVACSRTPKLLLCTPVSVLNSVMQAAQLGLEPGGPLGDAYLVPYKETCQLIVGYRGLISLARRSGQIESLEAHVVHAKDRFICRWGLSPVLDHEPDWSENPGAIVAVYAVAKLKDGGTQAEVMTKPQVDAIRTRSRASGEGPWVSDYEEMARKTVVRRLCKYLPLSVELADALDDDARAEFGASSNVIEIPNEVTDSPALETKTSQVKARLRAQQPKADDALAPGVDPKSMETPKPPTTLPANGARIQKLREELADRVGAENAVRGFQLMIDEHGLTSTWNDATILRVAEKLSTWSPLPVQDYADGEREPGSDDE